MYNYVFISDNLNLCTVFLHQNIFDALDKDIHHWSIILSIALLQQGLLVFLLVTVAASQLIVGQIFQIDLAEIPQGTPTGVVTARARGGNKLIGNRNRKISNQRSSFPFALKQTN